MVISIQTTDIEESFQFVLSVRDPQVGDVSGSNGFESDNSAGNGTTPITGPTFSNVTICGPSGAEHSSLYKRMNHLRRNTVCSRAHNSVFVGDYPVGLYIDGTNTR
ncbi:MAG: hypothetical protein R2778_02790 [Saprospiraceae bacterium]